MQLFRDLFAGWLDLSTASIHILIHSYVNERRSQDIRVLMVVHTLAYSLRFIASLCCQACHSLRLLAIVLE